MKILAFENYRSLASIDESFAVYPDSTLIRNNDDFYIPNFSRQIQAYVGIYLHFSKIGKCIEPRFVPRYFHEVGVGIKFMAADVMTRNALHGTQTDVARCFDSSLAVSNNRIQFTDGIPDNVDLTAVFNGNKLKIDQTMFAKIPDFVAAATKYFTIKIGDLFFLPCVKTPVEVAIGSVIDVSLQGTQLLTCGIK